MCLSVGVRGWRTSFLPWFLSTMEWCSSLSWLISAWPLSWTRACSLEVKRLCDYDLADRQNIRHADRLPDRCANIQTELRCTDRHAARHVDRQADAQTNEHKYKKKTKKIDILNVSQSDCLPICPALSTPPCLPRPIYS